jgi:hypothetical protein
LNRKIFIFSGIAVVIIGTVLAAQMNLGSDASSILKNKSYTQIEEYDVRNSPGTIMLSAKVKGDVSETNDFAALDVASFGYAWLRHNENNGVLSGVFSNVHTIDGFIGPWHSELVQFIPKDEQSFCLASENIVNEVSFGENLVRTILSEGQLGFSPNEIDRAASAVITEDYSCSSGFKVLIINSYKNQN